MVIIDLQDHIFEGHIGNIIGLEKEEQYKNMYGLEYKSVKVVIPSSNAERITHAIFYTAITRAKEQLKIFWSPETMDAIVKSFSEQKVEHRTLQLIKEKLNLLGK